MIRLEELISNGIKNLVDFEKYARRHALNRLFIVPEKIVSIVSNIGEFLKPQSAVILNSNLGEISSRLNHIRDIVSIDADVEKIQISKYFNQNHQFINENPLDYPISKKYDLVVTFPPLGQYLDVGGRRISLDILYIEKSLQLINENGSCILIVSGNFLSADRYFSIRNLINSKYYLSDVIKISKTEIVTISIDIYILVIKRYENPVTNYYIFKSHFDINSTQRNFSVSKSKLMHRWDFEYHNPANQSYLVQLTNFDTKSIDELVEIIFGIPIFQKNRVEKGVYKIFTPRNISDKLYSNFEGNIYLNREDLHPNEQKSILQSGDIVFSRFVTEKFDLYIHDSEEKQFIANQHVVILRGKNAEYVATYLNTEIGFSTFKQQIIRHASGASIPIISRRDLGSIRIPILPAADLKLASIKELRKLSYDDLLVIKGKYDSLKEQYSKLENQSKKRPFEQLLSLMSNNIEAIIENQEQQSEVLNRIETKIDDIKIILNELNTDFTSIKNLPRELEEKITRLNSSLDDKISKIKFERQKLDKYIIEIKNWFDYFDLLEIKSQKYLPEAEYIFDHISMLDNPDFSPFILQYCRALENELLNKIFRAYIQTLIDRKVNISEKFNWDASLTNDGKPNNENTHRLYRIIKKYLHKETEEWYFELGLMEVNLRYLTGKTFEKSPLLKDLRDFIMSRFSVEILKVSYLDEIREIIIDFRNQSAHPNLMDSNQAFLFHQKIKRCLINLMFNFNNA